MGDTWATKANMPTGRERLAAGVTSSDKLYAVGGDGGLNVNEEYTPPSAPTAPSGLTAVLQ